MAHVSLRYQKASLRAPSQSLLLPSDRRICSMDVLFNTINVRDPLPSSDADDPTSPLSAPELRLLIHKLDSHSRNVRSQVQSYLVSHHEDFSSLFSLCADVASRTDDVSADLDRVVPLVSADRPTDVEIWEVVEEIERKSREVRLRRGLLELARIICGISERFKGGRESVCGGRLRAAAEEIRDWKVAVRVSDKDGEGGRLLVYDLLRKEWFDCFEELQELLSRFVEKAVRFDKEYQRVIVKHHELDVNRIEGIDFHLVLYIPSTWKMMLILFRKAPAFHRVQKNCQL